MINKHIQILKMIYIVTPKAGLMNSDDFFMKFITVELCYPTCVHSTCDNGVCKCDAEYNGKACDKSKLKNLF